MLTCREFDEFIVDYLDYELPWSTQVSMCWYELLCSKCRAYLADYRRTIELGQLNGPRNEPIGDELKTAVRYWLESKRASMGGES